ncbi:hypothetical protein [Vulgatibacter sp.]|uniref:hypothetical protein n=1 Tax=Vulgatibacter sp. TaxID=1971226 RepID=UPI003569E630
MLHGTSTRVEAMVEVEKAIRAGLLQLAESYAIHWPAAGRNDAGERNLSLHVALGLREAGFITLAEPNFPRNTEAGVELIGLQPGAGVLAVVECKRLFSGEQAAALLADAARLEAFVLSDEFGPPPQVRHRVGVLLASTFLANFATWWVEAAGGAPPGVPATEPWEDLVAIVGSDACWGCLPLDRKHGYYGLYVVWPLP